MTSQGRYWTYKLANARAHQTVWELLIGALISKSHGSLLCSSRQREARETARQSEEAQRDSQPN